VFSGSNDRGKCDRQEIVFRYLNEVAQFRPVTLLSVIGGCFFLDIVKAVNVSRVHLFDGNVAEFAKLLTLLNLANKAPDRNPIAEMEKLYSHDSSFLMPSTPLGSLTWKVAAGATQWDFEGQKEDAFPFVLTSSLFPDYSIDFKSKSMKELIERLKLALDKKVTFDVPDFDAAGSLVVVFASNADPAILSPELFSQKIRNASGVIILRSEGFGGAKLTNESALDPHPYWEAMARSCLLGRSHHIWSPEDSGLMGSNYDSTTETSSVLGSSENIIPRDTETILTHIVFGKSMTSVEERKQLFQNLAERLESPIKRFVVAEYRPEGGAGESRPFKSSTDLTIYLQNQLADFQLTEIRYAPGNDDLKRNMFFIFDRLIA